MNTLMEIEKSFLRPEVPEFRAGDTVRVQVKVKETKPSALQAEVGAPRPVGETETMSWPITISIPAGTRAMSHADKGEYGKVILETTHPDHKEFVVDVSFLVIKAQP